jgi:hypothetical protein
MNMWIVLIIFTTIAFNLYAADTSYRLRDDMRVMKARTGKIIELLDAVLDGVGGEAAKAAASVRASTSAAADDKIDREKDVDADSKATKRSTFAQESEGGIDDRIIDSILAQVSKFTPKPKSVTTS